MASIITPDAGMIPGVCKIRAGVKNYVFKTALVGKH